MRRTTAVAALLAAILGGSCEKVPTAATHLVDRRPPPSKPVAQPPRALALPTPSAAQAIIESSSDFGEFEFTRAAVTLPLKVSAMNAPAHANAEQLVHGGWIRIDGDAVVLTPKATGDPRFLVRPNGFVDVVPIAKKKLDAVTAVRAAKDGAEADFEWEWVPTELGKTFHAGPVHDLFDQKESARATLLSDGTTWSVLHIEAK